MPSPSGLLVVDKPFGISSHDVVQKIRRLYGIRKVGHGGTLDPAATGVMVVALGKATRLLEYYSGQNKSYQAQLELGKTSDTGDSEGEITIQASDGSWPSSKVVEAVLGQFRGTIEQTPPLYSALKMGGEALYKKARRGEVLEVPTRKVTLYSLELVSYRPPEVQIAVECSKGTYIRSLAADIGAALKTGAYLTDLRRTASGNFSEERALTFAQLEAMSEEERQAVLLPLGFGLPLERHVELSPSQLDDVLHGRDIVLPEWSEGQGLGKSTSPASERDLFVFADQELVAILERRAGDVWKPRKVFFTH